MGLDPRKLPPIDPDLPSSDRLCSCGCGRTTYCYRAYDGSIKQAKYTRACYLRRVEAARRTSDRKPGGQPKPDHQRCSKMVDIRIRLTPGDHQKLLDLVASYRTTVPGLAKQLIVKLLARE